MYEMYSIYKSDTLVSQSTDMDMVSELIRRIGFYPLKLWR